MTPPLRLGVCPPSPVVAGTPLEMRVAWRSSEPVDGAIEVSDPSGTREVWRGDLAELSRANRGVLVPSAAVGELMLRVVAADGSEALEIVEVTDPDASRRLDGAWVDIYHHDEAEAVPFNAALASLTDADWDGLIAAMDRSGQSTVVVTAAFHNFMQRAHHSFDRESYPGHALYPSQRYPRRWPIGSEDPIEAILTACDGRGMKVFLGVGFFAFFDYTPESLAWCESVLEELWSRYGSHPSLYGWYLAHEQCGGLFTPGLGDPELQREEMIDFFARFTARTRTLSPEKFVMLATNPFGMAGSEDAYRRLLPHLDVLAPFGFHRMPEGDLSESEAIAFLGELCAEAGTHLWADLETFAWPLVNGVELHPRDIGGIVDDLARFRPFEKVLHYQFPGLMASREMRVRPGGPAAVALYEDYLAYADAARAPR